MIELAKKICPKCGEVFTCGAQDSTGCWCMSVNLSDAHRAELEAQYDGCLCPACLKTLITPVEG